jgi:uncharacterized alkaline shock family protein YloU
MRLFTLFGLLFNTIFFILLAVIIAGFALDWLTPLMIFNTVAQIHQDPNYRLILGLLSALIILISISFAQSVMGKMQREKNIAFATPSGQVSIALSAVEDLIRRLALQVPEVKSFRPDVVVNKKGIIVNLRIDLRTETSITELTERLQELIKNKIQALLRGIDEPISVRIHVAKIIAHEEKEKVKQKNEGETKEPPIPFYGYGR